MQGTIRTFIGFFITLGAVGSIELSTTDFDLAKACALAVVGIIILASGTKALSKQNEKKIKTS